ncbi:MAG: hypothetical protein RIR66_431 [Actinomycetota bacterium]
MSPPAPDPRDDQNKYVRVYLPVTKSDINALLLGQNLEGLTGYALLPQWEASQSETDQEILEGELLYLAASSTQKGDKRIVVVAETQGTVLNADLAQVSCGAFGLKQVQALFADDDINTVAISQGADSQDLDLTWFGPTEILEFWEFLSG